MAFWLGLVPLAYGAKKLYDVAKSYDAASRSYSSTSYDSSDNLKAAKIMRTKARRKALSILIDEHRERLRNALQAAVIETGVSIESSTPASFMVKHQNVGSQIQELTKVRQLFTEQDIDCHEVKTTKVSLHSKATLIEKALKQAEIEYGEFSGINHLNDYNPNDDQYLNQLIKSSALF